MIDRYAREQVGGKMDLIVMHLCLASTGARTTFSPKSLLSLVNCLRHRQHNWPFSGRVANIQRNKQQKQHYFQQIKAFLFSLLNHPTQYVVVFESQIKTEKKLLIQHFANNITFSVSVGAFCCIFSTFLLCTLCENNYFFLLRAKNSSVHPSICIVFR